MADLLAAQAQMLAIQTNGLVVNFGPSWLGALQPEFSEDYFINLANFIASERLKGMVYPPPDGVFSWTNYCTPDQVKVVIVGQDPYPRPSQAHGLCFSVPKGVAIPCSLRNIYKELKMEFPAFQTPQHGSLIGWAYQGVLLLNSCLTVREGQANSHQGRGWEIFTDAVISWLSSKTSGLVFILWGIHAMMKYAHIDQMKHRVLSCAHPVSLPTANQPFFGCKHFSRCNQYLMGAGKCPINWDYLP